MTEPAGDLPLTSFGPELAVAVVGATGGIGGAFVAALRRRSGVARVLALSRRDPGLDDPKVAWLPLDLESEATIAAAAAEAARRLEALHLVIVASGILHDGEALQPERSWRALDGAAMARAFQINATGPALVAKHFLPLLARDRKSAFAALSARVGSIGDNELGGWHAYRASKAGLNMILKTLSIELARRNPRALCVGLHPGTVDTPLSRPFQSSVPQGKLFTDRRAAEALLGVLDGLAPSDSGGLFAWDGSRIAY